MSTGSYLDNTSNRQGLERFAGVTLTKPGNRHIVQKPSSEKGISQFRIYPYSENGAEKPLRLEPAAYRQKVGANAGATCDFAFYPWITMEDAVFMAGTSSKFTAFTRVRGKEQRYQGPIAKFVRGMRQALKANPRAYPRDWADWTGNRGALPNIESVGLIQGILYTTAGKPVLDQTGKPAPQHPTLLILSKTARESLEQLCNLRHPTAQPDDEDFDRVFPYNRLVDTQRGSCITIIYHLSSKTTMAHYEIQVDQQPLPIPAQLAQEFVAWDNLLYFMDEAEQLVTLLSHFPAEAVDFVLGGSEFAGMLPETVKGRWDAFVRSGGVNQAPPPQGYQQYQQQPQQPYVQQAPMPPYQATPPQQMPPQPPPPWVQPPPQTVPVVPTQTIPIPYNPAPQPQYGAPVIGTLTSGAPALPPGAPPMPQRAATSPALMGAPAIFNAPSIQNTVMTPPEAAGPAAPASDPTQDQVAALQAARARMAAAQKR